MIEESDIKKIVDVSCAIPEGRKESYTKGLMFGFSGDFLTALSILIPQIENAVRYLAVECGEPVYNMNEEGIEEIKSMHAVLELEGVKESLDEDLIFALNTIFYLFYFYSPPVIFRRIDSKISVQTTRYTKL